MKNVCACGKELTGRQRQFCSDRCRMAANRTQKAVEDASQSPKANKSVTIIPLKANKAESEHKPEQPVYEYVDEKVYGRPAVVYQRLDEAWHTRPEPESPDDIPIKNNRGKYQRTDGSVYQIDATGQIHNLNSLTTNNVKPANYGLPGCECMHCQTNRANGNKHIIIHGEWKPANELKPNELNRVSLPGDTL